MHIDMVHGRKFIVQKFNNTKISRYTIIEITNGTVCNCITERRKGKKRSKGEHSRKEKSDDNSKNKKKVGKKVNSRRKKVEREFRRRFG